MPSVNFYLKKKEEATGKSLIYLQFKYNGYKLVYSFGQTIDPKQWNKNKQRVKSSAITTADGDYSLNETLDELEKICLTSYKSELKHGIPQPETLKGYLISFMHRNKKGEDSPTLYKLIDRFISGEIKNKAKDKTHGTLKKYITVKRSLKAFEIATRYPVDFDTINLDFFYKYVAFLKTERPYEVTRSTKAGPMTVKSIAQPMGQNTIAKQISHIKTFMNEAFDLKYTTNLEFKSKKFAVESNETDAVYLNEREIINLFKFDLSANRRLEQVRDLFVFGCCVGLRFSDFSQVRPEHIITIDGQKFIRMFTQKTREQVVIPCHPIVLQIFDKYADAANKLPKALSNQKFNQYIKEVCKSAGLTESGRLLTEPESELWECVSSHTARRSFATNLYLEGFPVFEIMKITGHKTEKAFTTYLKVSKIDAAKRLSKHMQLRWSEKLLKAV